VGIVPRVILTLLILGLAIYLIVRLVQGTDGEKKPPRPPVAPDDDPGFLRDLDDQLWREKKDDTEP
jgi:hypothetical protein